MTASLSEALCAAVGADHVLNGEAERRYFASDFVADATVLPQLVVSPADTEQVSAVVGIAAAHGSAVVGRGGGMSYTQAHCPQDPATVVIDLRRLNQIELHTEDRYVICGVGVTWEQLAQRLAGTGLWAGHLGTLSGRYATVGGGLSQQVIGLTGTSLTSLVLGLEVVLADGRVLRTGAWAAAGTAPFTRDFGPDLSGPFLCDSGAMGIKTRAVLRLDPVPRSSYGAFAFGSHRDMVAAMVEIGHEGLAGTCIGMDRYIVDQMTSMPPPPKEMALAMARQVVAAAKPKWRGVKTLARAGSPKMRYLNDVQNLLAVICDATDSTAADRLSARVARIAKAHGGRRLPISLPMGIRNAPFQEIHPLMFGKAGESNIPTNMIVPLSAARPLVDAIDAYVAGERESMDRFGVSLSYNWLLTGHAFGIEPLLYFPDRAGAYRLEWAAPEDRVRYGNAPENAPARAYALQLRKGLIETARKVGSAHIQIGRSYPLAAALEGTTTWDVLHAVKDALDPLHRVNPGVLGLEDGDGRRSRRHEILGH